MKHLSIKKLMLTLITIVCLFSFWTVSAQAASVTSVLNYADTNKTIKKDITGDGKLDTITFKPVKENAWFLEKINVFINGKKAATLKAHNSYAFSVKHISLSSKNVFLQVYGFAENDYVLNNNIYKYNKKTKKLENVLNFSKVAGGSSMQAQGVTSASGSQIKVYYTGQPNETGRIECTYTFVYKNGKFKLKSNTTSVKSLFTKFIVDDAYGKYLAKNQFVADKTLKFYAKTNLKKVAFTANKGDILALKKIKIANGKTYLQFKKGSKSGWVKVFNDFSSIYPDFEHGWFGGIIYRLAG